MPGMVIAFAADEVRDGLRDVKSAGRVSWEAIVGDAMREGQVGWSDTSRYQRVLLVADPAGVIGTARASPTVT